MQTEQTVTVIKHSSWRILFALALIYNYYIYKIDMISAFTQGEIDNKVYIKQPLGYKDPFIYCDEPDIT
jgi:hypothetical protein